MYLGIDLGTSSIKTVVINDEGSTVANSISELSISRPEALWSEQNPVDWLTAAEDAIKKLPKEIR
ncbi:MAG: FGGY family carbohydrate kinase, partial [Pseudomonadota bacterium]|nr:FGGY family carbohydrate kinase [Pseudomonadota bacterium]